MTETSIATTVSSELIEKVVIGGDLSKLTPKQRMDYYSAICESLGLNPLTRPFDYLDLHGKLVLYAKRDAADQLRKIHGISIDKPDVTITDDLVMVSVTGRDKTGRSDSELGVVYLGRKSGDDKANAILKAITKAKRRLTLSIVGLGWLDETEVETIPEAEHVYPEEHKAIIDNAADLAEAKREAADLDPLTPADNRPDTPPTAKRTWPADTVKAIVSAHLAKNPPGAVGMLNKSNMLRTTDDVALVLTWANAYRSAREDGKEPADAAKVADTALEGIEE